MPTVSASRTELRERRTELALARQGEALLEEKRTALLRELMRMASTALIRASELDLAAAAASQALHLAKALDGPAAVRSAALAAEAGSDRFEVVIEGGVIYGVAVPIVTVKERRRGVLERGYSLPFSSARIDDVGTRFEEVLNRLARLAEMDARMRRVGDEIQRTSRQVNALRQILIPALQASIDRTIAVLEEREREETFRLKRLKRLRRPD